MALLASISVSQGADNSKFTITDNSNYGGSDPFANIASRQLIFYKADGTVYRQPGQTTDEIDFDISFGATGDMDILGLERDLALSAVMVLTPVAAQTGSVYSVTLVFALVGYTMTNVYERMKKTAVQPRYEKDKAFTNDTHRLLLEQNNSTAAASNNDIEAAQLSLDRAYRIIQDNKLPY